MKQHTQFGAPGSACRRMLRPALAAIAAVAVPAAAVALRGAAADAATGEAVGGNAVATAILPRGHDGAAGGPGASHDPDRAAAVIGEWLELGRPAGESSPFAQEPDTTIVVRTVGETLEFTPTRIAAKNGTRVRIRYVNGGTLPHNLVVLRNDEQVDAIASAAYGAAATGFVPVEKHRGDMIAWTELASPGDTVDVTFVMPPPGEYTFICLYPGHYTMMFGVLRSLN